MNVNNCWLNCWLATISKFPNPLKPTQNTKPVPFISDERDQCVVLFHWTPINVGPVAFCAGIISTFNSNNHTQIHKEETMSKISSTPAEITKQEVEQALHARCREINIDPDEVIYSLCWGDVLGVIAEQLCERGLAPETLGGAELQALLDKAKDYVEGEGMPWHEVILLGVWDAWPGVLEVGSAEPEEG
jgi:hypothetical protein